MNDRYTPIDSEEADRLLRAGLNLSGVRIETAGVIENGEARFTSLGTGREKAQRLGWNIDPERSPGNPHAFGTGCTDKRCPCHGRTFVHYRRGA